MICVDDGSADDSVELIQEWTDVAPNLRVVSNDGQGIEAARKTGLSVAKGTKIVFLDPAARLMQDSALLHVQGDSSIKPAFAGNNIPIVAATDENYLEYTKVLLRSIIATTSSNIDFLILYNDIAEEKRREFVECFSHQENLSVRFVDMSEYVKSSEEAGFVGKRYPVSCSFRAYAPYILNEYKKVVYLDIDTIVCRDISELYNTDLGDSLLGCVVDVGNSSSRAAYANFARMHGFVEWDKYFNSGVLLMNFTAFRDCGLLDSLLKIIIEASKREFLPDQDALNFVCKGRVKYLDPRWNVQLGDYCIEKQLALTGDQIWIAHFTGVEKPWTRPNRRYPHLWWRHVDDLAFAVATWRKAFDVGDVAVCLGEGVAVSVIVPVYNAEPYLAQALVSLAAQTLRNIEVICVDDGSTDGSGAICERFAAADSRFRVLHQTNSGGAVARNRGIEEAKGRWLFFADADDFCRPDMLECLVKRGEEFVADVAIAGHYVIDTRFALQVNEQKVPQENLSAGDVVECTTDGVDVFAGSCTVPWNKLFRRDFVARNSIRFHQIPHSDDVYFSLVSLVKARHLCFIDRSFYYYRRFLPTSQMGVEEAQAPTNFLKAFLEVKKVLEGCNPKLQKQFFKVAISVCFMNLARRKTIEGIRKTYFALRDGGIQALQFKDVDDQSIDMGSFRNLYELTKAGALLDEVLLACYSARCDNDAAKAIELKCREINDLRALVEKRDEALADCRQESEELRALVEKRDGMLAKRDEALAGRRKEVGDLRALVEKRDGMLAKRDEALAGRRKEVEELRALVEKRDGMLAKRDEALAGHRKEIGELRALVEKRDGMLAKRDEALADRRKEVEDLHALVEKRDGMLAKRDEALADRRKEIGELRALVKKRDGMLAKRDEALAGRRKEVEELRALVKKRDGMLAKRDEALAGRRKEVEELRALVEKRDGMLAKRDASIIMYRNRVATLEKNLHSRDTEVAATNHEIRQLRNELAMQKAILSKIEGSLNPAAESN